MESNRKAHLFSGSYAVYRAEERGLDLSVTRKKEGGALAEESSIAASTSQGEKEGGFALHLEKEFGPHLRERRIASKPSADHGTSVLLPQPGKRTPRLGKRGEKNSGRIDVGRRTITDLGGVLWALSSGEGGTFSLREGLSQEGYLPEEKLQRCF